MANLDSVKIKYVDILLSTVLVSIMAVVVIRPLALRISLDYQQVKLGQLIKQKLQDNVTALDTAKKVQQDHASQIALIPKVIPTGPNEGSFLEMVQALTYKNSLSLLKADFSYKESGEVGFSFAFAGRYDNFDAFMKEMNTLIRVNNIDSVTIEHTDEDISGEVGIVITGKTFYKTAGE